MRFITSTPSALSKLIADIEFLVRLQITMQNNEESYYCKVVQDIVFDPTKDNTSDLIKLLAVACQASGHRGLVAAILEKNKTHYTNAILLDAFTLATNAKNTDAQDALSNTIILKNSDSENFTWPSTLGMIMDDLASKMQGSAVTAVGELIREIISSEQAKEISALLETLPVPVYENNSEKWAHSLFIKTSEKNLWVQHLNKLEKYQHIFEQALRNNASLTVLVMDFINDYCRRFNRPTLTAFERTFLEDQLWKNIASHFFHDLKPTPVLNPTTKSYFALELSFAKTFFSNAMTDAKRAFDREKLTAYLKESLKKYDETTLKNHVEDPSFFTKAIWEAANVYGMQHQCAVSVPLLEMTKSIFLTHMKEKEKQLTFEC
jgi:hypothetical protein